ncbi:MAG: MFS transporter [Spirochaetia bacterium]|nr:MFS transporter [Spirochaetia bacterium]
MKTLIKPSPYRYVVLASFMLITIAVEIQWLTHAPIARAASVYYSGQFNPLSLINVDFLSMSYMLLFLVFCIPASYVIDTYGIRIGITIGAVLAGTAGLIKGIYAHNFAVVVGAQLILAVSQPFIINGVTAVTVRWFPLKERGLAAGLASLAQYLGIIIVMAVTPMFVVTKVGDPNYGQGIDKILFIYGIMTAVSAIIAIIFIRERPIHPVDDKEYIPTPFFKGIKHILSLKDMKIALILFFIGLGVFNAVSSMVDAITGNLGVLDSDGLIGVFMLVGGVIGAVIIPLLSDKYMKRKFFLVLCIGGMVPSLFGLTFSSYLFPGHAYIVAIISSFLLGFFVMSAGPIGFQYAAEVSAPASESTSQGLLLLSGQITGLLFVAGMSYRQNIYLNSFMIFFFIIAIIALFLATKLKESPMMKGSE